ncbi:hypothetical protein DUI87_08406 [Hirundo rustica rustica]|uniref:Kinesin motor domain-containing protein n=1 Tax=Hirundo rustica rustica TaxID=333673 RepID=A0A3M0KSB6_HIRRU|nr:hypothetical protein DUI87_08406 [Hirundo rustica rustica]
MSDTKVKVAVRVRPMNRRELDLNTKCIVEMEGNQTVLHPPPSNAKQGESGFEYENNNNFATKMANSLDKFCGERSC